MEVDKKMLGRRIRNTRIKLGLTMEEFGKRVINANKSVVSKWEQGVSIPNAERLTKIAELSDLSVDELLYGDNQKLLELGNIIYKDLCKKYSNDTRPGKALRYFPKEQTESLIVTGMKFTMSVPFIADRYKTLEEFKENYLKEPFNLLPTYMMRVFLDEYTKEVISNSNLIAQVEDKVREIKILLNDYYKGSRINIDGFERINENTVISIDINDIDISYPLVYEITNIIDETLERLNKLKEKYPDEEYGKHFDINFHNLSPGEDDPSFEIARFSIYEDFNQLTLKETTKIVHEAVKSSLNNLNDKEKSIIKNNQVNSETITKLIVNILSK